VPIQRAGLLGGLEELGGDAADVVASRDQRFGDARHHLRSDQLRMAIEEGFDRLGSGRLTNEIGDIDGVEIAVRQEAPHCFQADVIGIEEVRSRPAQGLHGGIGGGPGGRRLGTNDRVFSVGLVPDRNDFDTVFQSELAGAQLGPRLVGKSVADADGKSAEDQGLAHGLCRSLTA